MRPNRLVYVCLFAALAAVGCSSSGLGLGPDAGSEGGGGSGAQSSGSAASGAASGAGSSGSTASGSASGAASGTTGTAGASAGAGTSGSSSSGGASGSRSGSTCPNAGASVTFEMSVPPGSGGGQYCYGLGCTKEFVTIRDASGQAVAIDAPECSADCGACVAPLCPATLCAAPSPLTATPVTRTWDGSLYEGSSCMSHSPAVGTIGCTKGACAPAGHYVATMCAYPSGPSGTGAACSTASQTPVCKDFPFDWPPAGGSATIKWVVGDADAGSPTGDAGLACFASTVPANYKTCQTGADCSVKVHQTDCCGARHYEGINKALSMVYDACESTWDARFPACNCFTAGLATTDDGNVVPAGSASAVVAACVTPPGGGAKLCETTLVGGYFDAGATGTVCGSNADCPMGNVCGFSQNPTCTTLGNCFGAPGATCDAYQAGCACDGTDINITCTGLPNGFQAKPLRHTGACVDGG